MMTCEGGGGGGDGGGGGGGGGGGDGGALVVVAVVVSCTRPLSGARQSSCVLYCVARAYLANACFGGLVLVVLADFFVCGGRPGVVIHARWWWSLFGGGEDVNGGPSKRGVGGLAGKTCTCGVGGGDENRPATIRPKNETPPVTITGCLATVTTE